MRLRGLYVVSVVCLAGAATATATAVAGVAQPTAAGVTQPTATAGAAQPTAENAFHGNVTAARGRLAGRHGRAGIGFFPTDSNSATRPLLITLRPRACRQAKGCVRLRGTLNGSITQVQSLPDTGSAFTISAHGTIHPLGRVTVSGTAHGVGNAIWGYESTRLTLTGGGGSVTISGTSGRVPAFSSP
ncbi:MAG TPA: hypothetical protein VGI87_10015 [Solirubrobacteraceae bacterium]|jgi:hypothetical protein